MSKLILRSKLSLGDIVLLTAAVRDLHRAYPGQFITDVRSCFPDLWRANPNVTALHDYAPDVRVLDCALPLIRRSEESASHCLHGFMDFFREALGLRVAPTEFRGDIHLSADEIRRHSPVQERTGHELPYWLICSGGKDDFTTKWWDAARYQQVVDHFVGRIVFVQVGDMAHHHPPLRGVLDFRGQTSVRDLVLLMHHAQGVLCGVTGLMHLAAAVPRPAGLRGIRPCVVVAGGREPAHWEAYPGHQFIHTIGALPCCAEGGCWRSRVQPLGDDDEKDGSLCVDVRGHLPRCMDLITAAEVIQRIERYFEGGAARYLSADEALLAAQVLAAATATPRIPEPLTVFNAAEQADEQIRRLPAFPGGFEGRGIVICGGGVRMFTNAWVCIRQLRRLGCTLPIELWHWGEAEMDDFMRSLVASLGVECVNGVPHAAPGAGGHVSAWAMKPLAVVHSRFREVLLLDADNLPVQNPEFLFEAPPYREAGAVLWPDFERMKPGHRAWKIFGVPYRDEPEVESGQVLVDKARCWAALQLCLWYNDNAGFFYRHVYGDKETFHLAFRKLGLPYSMPQAPVLALPGAMCQHDFQGRRLFQHRNRAKWRLFGDNQRIPGFEDEEACRGFLQDLAALWNGRIRRPGVQRTHATVAEKATPGLRVADDLPVAAVMTSCAGREAMREETLALLRRADWGDRPVRVFLDEHRFNDREESLAHNSWRALRGAVELGAEHILYLEDDLDFNRHLLHNLGHWPRLRAGQITLATLYNPDFPEVGWDIPPTAFAIDPRVFLGSQALIISRGAALYFLDHWFEGPQPVDLKMAYLAARLKWPLFCHNPSLVLHRGRQSVIGSGFHQARDFAPEWRAPAF